MHSETSHTPLLGPACEQSLRYHLAEAHTAPQELPSAISDRLIRYYIKQLEHAALVADKPADMLAYDPETKRWDVVWITPSDARLCLLEMGLEILSDQRREALEKAEAHPTEAARSIWRDVAEASLAESIEIAQSLYALEATVQAYDAYYDARQAANLAESAWCEWQLKFARKFNAWASRNGLVREVSDLLPEYSWGV